MIYRLRHLALRAPFLLLSQIQSQPAPGPIRERSLLRLRVLRCTVGQLLVVKRRIRVDFLPTQTGQDWSGSRNTGLILLFDWKRLRNPASARPALLQRQRRSPSSSLCELPDRIRDLRERPHIPAVIRGSTAFRDLGGVVKVKNCAQVLTDYYKQKSCFFHFSIHTKDIIIAG